jgi:hypothetical protein
MKGMSREIELIPFAFDYKEMTNWYHQGKSETFLSNWVLMGKGGGA